MSRRTRSPSAVIQPLCRPPSASTASTSARTSGEQAAAISVSSTRRQRPPPASTPRLLDFRQPSSAEVRRIGLAVILMLSLFITPARHRRRRSRRRCGGCVTWRL